jgi:hypothetical protein
MKDVEWSSKKIDKNFFMSAVIILPNKRDIHVDGKQTNNW